MRHEAGWQRTEAVCSCYSHFPFGTFSPFTLFPLTFQQVPALTLHAPLQVQACLQWSLQQWHYLRFAPRVKGLVACFRFPESLRCCPVILKNNRTAQEEVNGYSFLNLPGQLLSPKKLLMEGEDRMTGLLMTEHEERETGMEP